ncbi:hypothetical protein DRQ50_10380, partial [bacterium]
MKKRHGYSLNIDGKQALILKIRTVSDTSYCLEFVERTGNDHPESLERLRELTRPRRRVVTNLPNDGVHLLTAKLPALASKALTSAIQGVVNRKEGGLPGDWITQHTQLPAEPGPTLSAAAGDDYCIIYADSALLAERFTLAEEVGCHPLGMLPDFLALEDLFRRHGPEGRDNGPWNLVFLGQDERFLCVGDEHGLLFSRPLPEDLSGDTDRTDYLERLATEIERSSFFAQQAERSLVVRNIMICGQPDLADELAEHLKQHVDAIVQRWRPEDIFETEVDEPLWPLTLHLGRAVAAVHGPLCELLPPGAKGSPVKLVSRQVGIALAAFVTGAVSMLLAGGLLTSHVQQDYLREADVRINRLYTLAGQASADYLQNRALQARQDNVDRLGR